MQQHTVPEGGPGPEGAPLRVPELRPPGGRRQQLRVPERGAPQRGRVHAGAAGRRRRPDAAEDQVRAMRGVRARRGRLLPGHGARGGRDDALLRLLQPELRRPLEGVSDGAAAEPSAEQDEGIPFLPLMKQSEGHDFSNFVHKMRPL